MKKFKITYTDPETKELKTKTVEFQDFVTTGEMTISARESVIDYACSLAKGGYCKIEEL